MGWNDSYKLSPDWPNPVLGAGLSRPHAKERTRLYRMEVQRVGSPVMRVTIPAATNAIDAEEALAALDQADKGLSESEWQQRSDTIRRALERLQELEGAQ